MKSTAYFGRTIDCSCGRRHVIAPNELVYADDAVERLPDLCARATGRKAGVVMVLMDARTQRAAGDEAVRSLHRAGWKAAPLVVPDPAPGENPVCDDRTQEALLPQARGADLLVSVGAGVVNDLGKWLALDLDLPFVTFATAASMNGYTSANIAPTLRGVKSLVQGRPPWAVVSSPAVLAKAPYELTAAGLGDALAKSASSADWRMNHILFGDYYCAASVDLIAEIEPLYRDNPRAVRDRKPEALAALFDALLLTGVAMTMAESSAPASGGEHLISHSLDMLANVEDKRHDLHGRQVGVGTILASELYARVLAEESPDFGPGKQQVDRRLWGSLADEVTEQFAQKQPRIEQARTTLRQGGRWDELRSALAAMIRPAEQIRDCLQAAGAAACAADIDCGRDRLETVLRHADEIRTRFTILDLAHLTGVLPRQAREIIEAFG